MSYGMWQKGFAYIIKATDLKTGRLSWIVLVGSIQSHELLKTEDFLRLETEEMQKRKSEKFKTWEGLDSYPWLRKKGKMTREAGGQKELWEATSWQPARKETSDLCPQENEFCQQPEWVWKQILPESFHQANNLISVLWDQGQRNQTSDLENHKIISLCCFKPPSMWSFVMTATEGYCTS